MTFVVGIDVGAKKKGFHCAVLRVESDQIDQIIAVKTPEELVRIIKSYAGECRAIAIDCPSKAMIQGEKTRLAERELHKAGYRVQWTPRESKNVQEWMSNGEGLWELLKKEFKCKLIETFPTASCNLLRNVDISLPLSLLCGKEKREHYKDFIDACICASVARAFLEGKTFSYGRDDELGPIHTLV